MLFRSVYAWENVSAGVTINNSFFITNGTNMVYEQNSTAIPARGVAISEINGENKAKYGSVSDLANDVADGYISIASFDNAYWTITSGVPVWNGLSK